MKKGSLANNYRLGLPVIFVQILKRCFNYMGNKSEISKVLKGKLFMDDALHSREMMFRVNWRVFNEYFSPIFAEVLKCEKNILFRTQPKI